MVSTHTRQRFYWFAFPLSSVTDDLFWRGEARRSAAIMGIRSVTCGIAAVFSTVDHNIRNRGFRGGKTLIFSLLVLKYDL